MRSLVIVLLMALLSAVTIHYGIKLIDSGVKVEGGICICGGIYVLVKTIDEIAEMLGDLQTWIKNKKSINKL